MKKRDRWNIIQLNSNKNSIETLVSSVLKEFEYPSRSGQCLVRQFKNLIFSIHFSQTVPTAFKPSGSRSIPIRPVN